MFVVNEWQKDDCFTYNEIQEKGIIRNGGA